MLLEVPFLTGDQDVQSDWCVRLVHSDGKPSPTAEHALNTSRRRAAY